MVDAKSVCMGTMLGAALVGFSVAAAPGDAHWVSLGVIFGAFVRLLILEKQQ